MCTHVGPTVARCLPCQHLTSLDCGPVPLPHPEPLSPLAVLPVSAVGVTDLWREQGPLPGRGSGRQTQRWRSPSTCSQRVAKQPGHGCFQPRSAPTCCGPGALSAASKGCPGACDSRLHPHALCASRSDERRQPLADSHQRCPVRLQQWPGHLLHGLAVHAAAAPGVRGAAAQQTEALPGHPAAVRQRHLAGDRGARAHAGAGARGESGGRCGFRAGTR